MDGNNRWAEKRSLSTKMGHQAGSQAVITLVKSAIDFGVKYLTIYAFSNENWQRPKQEVSDLMSLVKGYLENKVGELIDNGVRIIAIGDLSRVNPIIKEKIRHVEQVTKSNKRIVLNIAFDYGSRQEIVNAFKKIAHDVKSDKIQLNQIDESVINNNLYTCGTPDPDLLIRTSGEQRVSNFLLWQIAYTEFYFTEKLWPDFAKEDLYQAILDFNQRKRRYGKR